MYEDLEKPGELTDYESYIYSEIVKGLPSEQDRLTRDFTILRYYNNDVDDLIRRDGGDYDNIPFGNCGLTKSCTDILTSLTYAPPPTRTIYGDEESTKFLDKVYSTNHINHKMQAADVLSTLLGYCAIEAVPAEDNNILLNVWDASCLVIFPDEDDSTKIGHVITRDLTSDRKTVRYTWWSSTFRRVFLAKQAFIPGLSFASRGTKEVQSTINPFGRIPFGFIHYKLPVVNLTVPGRGEWLSKKEASINQQQYNLNLAVSKYLYPIPWVGGVSPNWQPSTQYVGEFLRLPSEMMSNGTSTPTFGYLQAELKMTEAAQYIEDQISQVLEAARVPESIYRINQSSTMSGAAIEAEQAPLVDYTRNRQEVLKPMEADLARAILAVAGGVQGNEALMTASQTANLSVEWPQDITNVPGVDQDTQDRNAIEMGIESPIDLARRRFRLPSDEEAVRRLVKVQKDNELLRSLGILPPIQNAASPAEDTVDPNQKV